MRPLIVVLCALSCLIPAGAIAVGPDDEGASLEGAVTKAGSGEPIAGARVMLMAGGPIDVDVETEIPSPDVDQWASPAFTGLSILDPTSALASTTTDSQGRYTFNNLDPRMYRVVAFADGYVPREHGQRIPGTFGTPLTLSSGQRLRDVSLSLTHTGNIEGRLLAVSGRALPAVPVYLWRYVYDSDGKRHMCIVGAALTDDRGRYRIFWIPPGPYYLSAGGPVDSYVSESDDWQALSHYPGANDPANASRIDILPASEQTIDWVLPSPRSFHIRALVKDSHTGAIPDDVSTSVQVRGILPDDDWIDLDDAQVHYESGSGLLDIMDLIPGLYEILVHTPFRYTPPLAPAPPPPSLPEIDSDPLEALRGLQLTTGHFGATRLVVRVIDADVDGIVLDLASSKVVIPDIDGQVIATAGARRPAFEDLTIVLHSADEEPKEISVEEDGAFAIRVKRFTDDFDAIVADGEYRLSVSDLPKGWWVQSATIDGVDALTAPVHFGAGGKLRIVLSSKVGVVEGVVRNAADQPTPGVLATLIPTEARLRAELYQRVLTDKNGKFRFDSVPPGAYAVYGWEALEPNAYFDPDVIARASQSGAPIRVTGSSRQTVNVTLVPAEVAP